jgi:putative component of toxin-antitoxin plasmid stabilization module
VIVIREYIDGEGNSPFGRWFAGLNAHAAAKIATSLKKLRTVISQELNLPEAVFRNTRIYFGKDGETFVILVGGGTKKHQSFDIQVAKGHWAQYKKRKRVEKRQEY